MSLIFCLYSHCICYRRVPVDLPYYSVRGKEEIVALAEKRARNNNNAWFKMPSASRSMSEVCGGLCKDLLDCLKLFFFFHEKIYSDKIRNNLGNGSFPRERREGKRSRTGTSTHFRYGDWEVSGFFFWRYVSQISVSFAPYLDRRVVGCTSTRFLSWRVNLDPLFLQLAGSPFCRQRPTFKDFEWDRRSYVTALKEKKKKRGREK